MYRRIHNSFFGRFGRRKLLNHPSRPINKDAIGKIHDLRKVGRDHDDRDTFIRQPAYEFMNFGDGTHVHATRGLVEYDQLWFLYERFGDYHLLLVSAGKFYDFARWRRVHGC